MLGLIFLDRFVNLLTWNDFIRIFSSTQHELDPVRLIVTPITAIKSIVKINLATGKYVLHNQDLAFECTPW